MAYFLEHPDPQPGVNELKRRMGAEGALYWDVKATDDFTALVRRHLITVAEEYVKLRREQGDGNSHKPQSASYTAIVYEPADPYEGEPEVLILQRSLKSKTGPGQWQLPGGKAEEGEPSASEQGEGVEADAY
jgi:8-oxo-dGTP pyrophosphatase MutT (NUDIX family)